MKIVHHALLLLSLAMATQAEEYWEKGKYEDGSEIEYGYSDKDYRSIHRLGINLGLWLTHDLHAPLVSWYEPEKFRVIGSTNLLDLSVLLFHTDVDDSIDVRINSEYAGNNTVNVYHADVPISRGFEHGPHAAIALNEYVSSKGAATYALGYSWIWTSYSEYFAKPGRTPIRHTRSKQKALHLDACLFPKDSSYTDIRTAGVRLYLDGYKSF